MTAGLPEIISSERRPDVWARLLILVAVVLSTVRLVEAEPLQSANDRSRWTTVWSLVERGTFQIDEIIRVPGWDSIDKVRHEEHFYSSKPPLLATFVAGCYWVVKHTLGWTISPTDLAATAGVTQLILWFINILPTWIALECLARIIWRNSTSNATRAFVLAAACFGTLWMAYLPSLNNHTPALCCVVFAIAAVNGAGGGPISNSRLALAGFFASMTVANELPAAAFLAGLGLLLARRDWKRTIVFFGIGAVLPLAAHFVTNALATGSWKPFYSAYGTEKYRYVFEGIPSYWMDPKGVDKARDSFGTYLLHCTIGHHGLFSLTPILLLSLAGAALVPKWKSTRLSGIHALGIALTLIVFGFYLSRPDHYNYGGVSVGLRWMIWLTPFWLLLLIPACDALDCCRPSRIFACLLLAGSIFSAWHPFAAPWRQPWIYEWMHTRGWIDYRDPPPAFDRPMRSWITQLPTAPAKQADYWVELSTTELDGRPITLRIEDGGPTAIGDRAGRRIDFLWNAGRATERKQSVIVDVARFTTGENMADCLLWPEGAPGQATINESVELLRGVPSDVAYRSATIRYLRLPLRIDAFRCHIGVAVAGRKSLAPGIPSVTIRSEFWSSPEIPFGVAVWDIQTSDPRAGQTLSRRRMSVSSVGRIESQTP
jgi:hypothetical protein